MTKETAVALGLSDEMLVAAGWTYCEECGRWVTGECNVHQPVLAA